MGSGKKQTIGHKYFLGMHLALCHGQVDKFQVIRVGDKVAWAGDAPSGSIYVDEPGLFGGDKREGGVQGVVDLIPGSPTETPNGYLQAKIGTNIPGFRGIAAAVLRQCYLGTNPYLKPWGFRCQRIHKTTDGADQWYDAKAAIPSGAQTEVKEKPEKLLVPMSATLWRYSQGPGSGYTSPDFDDSSWPLGTAGFGDETHTQAPDGWPASPATIVDEGGMIVLRRRVTASNGLEPGRPLYIRVFADNIPYAWWNGQQITLNLIADWLYEGILYDNAASEGVLVVEVVDTQSGGGNLFHANCYLTHPPTQATAYPQYDMNPSHIIRESLTDPDWGMGNPAAEMNDAAFTAAADRLYTESMGISLLWDRSGPIEYFIAEILRHIDATVYVDPTTGLYTIKLIRDDYDPNSLPVLDPSNIESLADFARPGPGELINAVTVTYWNAATGKDASLTVQDIALQQRQGATIGQTVNYPGFTNATIATRAAQRDLAALSTPLASCTIIAHRSAAGGLNPGDVFKLIWPDYGITEMIMRVTKVARGDGRNNRVRLTCTQDAFALPTQTMIPAIAPAWEDPAAVTPIAATNRLAFEVPYLELVQQLTQSTVDDMLAADPALGYVGVAVARAQAVINAVIMTDAGAGYTDVGTAEFCPAATLAEAVTPGATLWLISTSEDLDAVTPGTWAQIGSEIVVFVSQLGNLLTVKRGALDTLPVPHAAGDLIYFWDLYAAADATEYASGENVSVKLLPSTGRATLALDDAPVDIVTLAQRALRPYPPGNLAVNGSYFPATIGGGDALALTWAHRDRLQQTGGVLIGFTDGSIGPEAGTAYTLRIYGEAGTLLHTESGLAGTAYTYPADTERTETGIPADNSDIYWSYVTLLLHLDGTDGSTSITDAAKGHAFTVYGNAQIDTAIAKFTASLLLDGSGDYITTPNSADFAFGSGDFTVECFVYVAGTTGANQEVLSYWSNTTGWAWEMYISSDAKSAVFNINGGGLLSGTITSFIGGWHHIAVSRNGSTWRLFIDGVLKHTVTSTATINSTGTALTIGSVSAPITWYFKGNIDEVRITKGIGRYTASFTPPTIPFPDGTGGYRLNGKLRFELEAARNGLVSYQKYNHSMARPGYGFNYGEYYGGV